MNRNPVKHIAHLVVVLRIYLYYEMFFAMRNRLRIGGIQKFNSRQWIVGGNGFVT